MNGVRIEIATPSTKQAHPCHHHKASRNGRNCGAPLPCCCATSNSTQRGWRIWASRRKACSHWSHWIRIWRCIYSSRRQPTIRATTGVQHSMLCATVCSLCSAWFDWSEDDGMVVVKAALTMNIAISAMQNDMARQTGRLSEIQRIAVANHASESSAMLQRAGVTDQLWLSVVQQHHDTTDGTGDLPLSRAQRLTQLCIAWTSTPPSSVDACLAPRQRQLWRRATPVWMLPGNLISRGRQFCVRLDFSRQAPLCCLQVAMWVSWFAEARRPIRPWLPPCGAVMAAPLSKPERRDTTISKFAWFAACQRVKSISS